MSVVAILGTGRVGRALGERILHAGESLCFGTRRPDEAHPELAGPLAGAPTRLPADATSAADIVVLAVPAMAAIDVARSSGDLAGKILIDCTNPSRREGKLVWSPPPEGSMAQAIAAACPGTHVVKGFNHFGAEIARHPELVSGPVDAFFAGDDGDAKARVMDLATRMGFSARDAGPLAHASLLENLAVLWIYLASAGGGRDFGFRLERQV